MSPNRSRYFDQAFIDGIIQGYAEMVQERIDAGWDPYIITFMFNQLGGSRETVVSKMMADVEKTYGRSLTRIIRCPNSRSQVGHLPIWIVSADYPVPKMAKKALRDVALNNGMHVGGIVLLPRVNRLDCRLDGYLVNHQQRYVGGDTSIRRIVATPITATPEKTVDYTFKALKRCTVGFDDIRIFPRSRSEVSSWAA